jgi:large subunit ribosomal protein L30
MADEENTVPKKAAKNPVKKAAVKKAASKKAVVKKTVAKKAVPEAEAKVTAETAAPKAAPKKAVVKKADSAVKRISVTLVRSKHGRLASHKACVAGLGLRRMHQTVQVIDTPENRGMIKKVQYMLNVEEA